jgi:hypothetical protein
MYIYQTIVIVANDDRYTVRNDQVHNYFTRSSLDVHRVQRRTNVTSNSPFTRGAIYYNKLPRNIKALKGKKFTYELKKWLVSKCPYSLNLDD